MRLAVALLTYLCLSACSVMTPEPVAPARMSQSDEWRQKQAVLDANAILQGMAQARQRAQMMARTSR